MKTSHRDRQLEEFEKLERETRKILRQIRRDTKEFERKMRESKKVKADDFEFSS